MQPSPIKRWFLRLFENYVLSFPFLSEHRLAKDLIYEFLRVWHYLSRANIRGDYLEFGVYEGASFNLSMRSAEKFFPKGSPDSPRFFAFDSFQGLPAIHPERDSAVYGQGQYEAGLDTFKKNIKKASRGWEIVTVPGFFDSSLTPQLLQEHKLRQAAFVNIDCDLYGSTLTALRFVTPLLRTGSVLYFDDWFFSSGDMRLGEPGACSDWLRENPSIRLVEFGNVAIMGKLFIVNLGPA